MNYSNPFSIQVISISEADFSLPPNGILCSSDLAISKILTRSLHMQKPRNRTCMGPVPSLTNGRSGIVKTIAARVI